VLVEYARGLKLDAKQFDSCLTSEKYKAEIEMDEEDAERRESTERRDFSSMALRCPAPSLEMPLPRSLTTSWRRKIVCRLQH